MNSAPPVHICFCICFRTHYLFRLNNAHIIVYIPNTSAPDISKYQPFLLFLSCLKHFRSLFGNAKRFIFFSQTNVSRSMLSVILFHQFYYYYFRLFFFYFFLQNISTSFDAEIETWTQVVLLSRSLHQKFHRITLSKAESPSQDDGMLGHRRQYNLTFLET